MHVPLLSNSGRAVAPEDKDGERTKELIRQLQVAVGAEPTLALQQKNICEEIIVDIDVDGARYLLVRMPSATRSLISLSPREHEIVRMVAKGLPNKTIAGVFNISAWTVQTHLRRIFAKLGVTSRAAMIARLMKEDRVWDPIRSSEKQRRG